jgi:transposase
VARYAGLTGSPDESGAKRREQGLARAGNARVRRSMIQLAWRFLLFQKESALDVIAAVFSMERPFQPQRSS